MADVAPEPRPRLIDLAVEWPLQYANESTQFDPSAFPGLADRLGQIDGYLSEAAAALDWTGAEPGVRIAEGCDPWETLGGLLARIEAEFAGRLLIGPEDLDRWRAEPAGGLTWAVASVRGLAELVRSADDAARLIELHRRGVRAFRIAGLVSGPAPVHRSGFSCPLREALSALAADIGATGPRAIIDLAGLGRRAFDESLNWLEGTVGLDGPLVPIVSLAGFGEGPNLGEVARLRAIGGVVGLGVGRAFHRDVEAIARSFEAVAATPFRGRPGAEGIAIGTGFLGVEGLAEGVEDAESLLDRLAERFDPGTVRLLARSNAEALLDRLIRR